jgi:superfamily II DNA/RNA helicase
MKAQRAPNELTEQEREAAIKAFEGLGLCTQLAESAAALGWKQPSPIQQQTIPPLIQGGLGGVGCMCVSVHSLACHLCRWVATQQAQQPSHAVGALSP